MGDAAEVDDGRVRARPQVLQERVMIGNRYGRAMSSRANVVGPEIIDDIDAGAIGHQSAIPKLAGISLPAVVWRLVQHRLAVEDAHSHGVPRDVGLQIGSAWGWERECTYVKD